jgi:hypothetical protein
LNLTARGFAAGAVAAKTYDIVYKNASIKIQKKLFKQLVKLNLKMSRMLKTFPTETQTKEFITEALTLSKQVQIIDITNPDSSKFSSITSRFYSYENTQNQVASVEMSSKFPTSTGLNLFSPSSTFLVLVLKGFLISTIIQYIFFFFTKKNNNNFFENGNVIPIKSLDLEKKK